MERITQAVLAGIVGMGLVACSDMSVEAQAPATAPPPAEREVGADAEDADAFGAELSAQGKEEHWTSYVYYFVPSIQRTACTGDPGHRP